MKKIIYSLPCLLFSGIGTYLLTHDCPQTGGFSLFAAFVMGIIFLTRPED